MKRRIATYLSLEQHASLSAMSDETDIPIARLVARAVQAYLESHSRDTKNEEVMLSEK